MGVLGSQVATNLNSSSIDDKYRINRLAQAITSIQQVKGQVVVVVVIIPVAVVVVIVVVGPQTKPNTTWGCDYWQEKEGGRKSFQCCIICIA